MYIYIYRASDVVFGSVCVCVCVVCGVFVLILSHPLVSAQGTNYGRGEAKKKHSDFPPDTRKREKRKKKPSGNCVRVVFRSRW